VKELQGRASTEFELAPEDVFDLLAAVERYPGWFEVVRNQLELTWRVGADESTWLELEFDAAASFVPGFLPVGDAGDANARAAIEAARDALNG
jgi:hypothetical protein